MTKEEALKLALEWYDSGNEDRNEYQIMIESILAQQEPEPVAYCYVQKSTSVDILTFDDAPDDAVDGTIFPLYTTPPKREWVDLTPKEVHTACWASGFGGFTGDRERSVHVALAKLKEKNT